MKARWVVHNTIAHPLLILCPPLGRWLHDRTAPTDENAARCYLQEDDPPEMHTVEEGVVCVRCYIAAAESVETILELRDARQVEADLRAERDYDMDTLAGEAAWRGRH